MSNFDVLKRCEKNPIIRPEDIPDCDSVFNCGATKFKDKYVLLLSVIKRRSKMLKEILVAESEDGVNFKISEKPFILPSEDPLYKKLEYDVCDPRITLLEGTYYVTYPAHSPGYGQLGVLGKTDDFKSLQRIGIISLPDNRCPVLFPEKVEGLYVRLDRPFGVYPGSIWISYSPDLIYWGKHRSLILPDDRYWCNLKVGPTGAPIKTEEGWLLIYHTVSGPKIGPIIYYLGAALLDLKDPSKVIAKTEGPILTPTELYERVGKVPNVVFSCGAIPEENGELKIYYGAADTCIGLATCSLNDLLKMLK